MACVPPPSRGRDCRGACAGGYGTLLILPARRRNHLVQQGHVMTGAIILAAGFLIMFVGSGARFAIGLTLRPMAEEFAMGREMLGLAVALYFVVTAIAMMIAGRLVDIMSARWVLAIGLVVSAIGIGLISVVAAPWQLLVLYGLVFGAGNGIASITPVSILATRAFPNRAGMANGIISAGMSAGQLVMIAAMAAALLAVGWRSIYVWLAVAHIVLLPLLFTLPGGAASMRQAANSAPAGLTLGEAARRRSFWLLLPLYAICGFCDFFVSTHVVAFAQDRGAGALLAGNLLAAMGLTALIGTLIAGTWSDRAGPAWPSFACFVIRIVSFVVILIDQSPVSVAIFALLFGITFLMTAPLTVMFMRQAFGDRNLGTITGVVIMVHHMCGGLAAWLGGAVFDARGNYDVMMWASIGSSAIAALLSLALQRELSPAKTAARS